MERFSFYPPKEEKAFKTEYAKKLEQKFKDGYLEELQPLKQWVVWKSEYVNGKKTKPPYNCVTGRRADPTNPREWSYLNQALRALMSGAHNGIGFALSRDDPYTVIDLDDTVGLNHTVYYPGKSAVALCKTFRR